MLSPGIIETGQEVTRVGTCRGKVGCIEVQVNMGVLGSECRGCLQIPDSEGAQDWCCAWLTASAESRKQKAESCVTVEQTALINAVAVFWCVRAWCVVLVDEMSED